MIQSFNQTMNYIENMLQASCDLDETKILQLSGYSYPMFSRLFSILVGIPLSEYLRNRRLSCAAAELRETDSKIIDVALKYGYESPDSFTAAFKKLHKSTPSEVRDGKAFSIFSPIYLSLSIEGGNQMNVQIKKIPAFKVAGVLKECIDATQCPSVWEELFAKAKPAELVALGSGKSFGACIDTTSPDSINYMACFDVADKQKAEELGLTIVEIPEAEYAIVQLIGAIPDSIHRGWDFVLKTFFPSNGYRHAGTPDFEFYPEEGDMHSEDYQMELWVPIVKA